MTGNRMDVVYPVDEAAERAVLSSVLVSADSISEVMDVVQPVDFYVKGHAAIYQAMLSLHTGGRAIDTVTLERQLRDTNTLPEDYSDLMRQILMERSSAAYIGDYAKIVADKASLRRTLFLSDDLQGWCKSGQSADSVMERLEQSVSRLSRLQTGTDLVDMAAAGERYLELLDRLMESPDGCVGIPTGLDALDHVLHGLQEHTMYVLGARPGMGKSAFALAIANHIAFQEHKPVLMMSMEMEQEDYLPRLASIRTHIPMEAIKTGRLTPEQRDAVVACVHEVTCNNLLSIETEYYTLTDIRRIARRHKVQRGTQLIIIDYLQLMSAGGNGNSSENRQQELANISQGLKRLSKELSVPILALVQLSRKVDERENKRPILSDIRDSGSIEQDADVVMFLYRDDYYYTRDDDSLKGVAEILIRKHRGGPTEDALVAWQPERTAFVNYPVDYWDD